MFDQTDQVRSKYASFKHSESTTAASSYFSGYANVLRACCVQFDLLCFASVRCRLAAKNKHGYCASCID